MLAKNFESRSHEYYEAQINMCQFRGLLLGLTSRPKIVRLDPKQWIYGPIVQIGDEVDTLFVRHLFKRDQEKASCASKLDKLIHNVTPKVKIRMKQDMVFAS